MVAVDGQADRAAQGGRGEERLNPLGIVGQQGLDLGAGHVRRDTAAPSSLPAQLDERDRAARELGDVAPLGGHAVLADLARPVERLPLGAGETDAAGVEAALPRGGVGPPPSGWRADWADNGDGDGTQQQSERYVTAHGTPP